MEQIVRQAGKLAARVLVIGLPAIEPFEEQFAALYNFAALEPGVDRLGIELNENPFAAVLDCGEPRHVQRKGSTSDLEIEIVGYIAVNISNSGLESGETDLRRYFA